VKHSVQLIAYKLLSALATAVVLFRIGTLLSTPVYSQEVRVPKSDRAFLSSAYYDIFEKNISGEYLERLVLFVNSFGDKAFAKDLVLKNWLFYEDESNSGSGEGIAKNDIQSLLNLVPPGLEGSPKEKIRKPIVFAFMQALMDAPGSFFENEAFLTNSLNNIIPQLLEADIFEDPDRLAAFLVEHPQELKNAVTLFDQSFKDSKRENAEDFFNDTKNAVRKKYPLVDLFLPLDLPPSMIESRRKLPSLEPAKEDVSHFIQESYRKLLYRDAEPAEISEWIKHLTSEGIPKAELLYYIIMSSEEYQFH
jgi:hypothetical protein